MQMFRRNCVKHKTEIKRVNENKTRNRQPKSINRNQVTDDAYTSEYERKGL